jgi:hypothetical protein
VYITDKKNKKIGNLFMLEGLFVQENEPQQKDGEKKTEEEKKYSRTKPS